jgi:hypothetical protein
MGHNSKIPIFVHNLGIIIYIYLLGVDACFWDERSHSDEKLIVETLIERRRRRR